MQPATGVVWSYDPLSWRVLVDLRIVSRLNKYVFRRFGLHLSRTTPTRAQIKAAHDFPEPEPIESVDDLMFRSNRWNYTVPVEKMVGRPIFGYGPHSWHPLKAACAELLDDPDAPYETSILRRFYATFQPETIADANFVEGTPFDSMPANGLFEPWTLPRPPFHDPHTKAKPSGTPVFGPRSDAAGEVEWARLRRSVESVRVYGYQPHLFPQGRINVTVLRSQGQERYQVMHGLHRTAVLSAMGSERIEVGIDPRNPWIIDEDQVDSWPFVKSGFVPREQAIKAIRRYFTEPGTGPAVDIGRRVESGR